MAGSLENTTTVTTVTSNDPSKIKTMTKNESSGFITKVTATNSYATTTFIATTISSST